MTIMQGVAIASVWASVAVTAVADPGAVPGITMCALAATCVIALAKPTAKVQQWTAACRRN